MRFSLALAILLLAAAALVVAETGEIPVDPVGTILIEDNDTVAMETTFEAKPKAPSRDLMASGGTVTAFAAAKSAGDGSQKVTVSPTIPTAGWYQVWMRWTTFLNTVAQHEKSVPATIFSKGGEFPFTINQQSGNRWALLGTYQFAEGKQKVISFSNDGTTQGASWDAVKLIPLAGKPAARPAPALVPGEDGFAKLARNITNFEVAEAYGRGNEETNPDAIRMASLNELRARMGWDLLLDPPTEKTNSNWTQFSNSASFMLTREAGMLKDMAVAYAGASNHLGMDLCGNPELLKATLRGIENFTKRYNDTTKWDVNWWDFEYGVPLRIFPAMIVLGDAVPQSIRDGYVATARRFNEDPRKFYNNGPESTGANRLWGCQAAMLRGTLAKDQALLDLVKESIMPPLEYVMRDLSGGKGKKGTSDGYYEDGSFIQHGGIPYVASYGYMLLESYAAVAECLLHTPWELNAPAAQNAFRIMEICFDPFVVRGETVQNVVGRSLGSKNYEGNRNAANFVVTASKLLPFANAEQKARLKSLIKKWITEEKEGKLLDLTMKTADAANPVSAAMLREIADDKAVIPLPARTGFEMFANMDMATHRAGDFTFSLGMNSTRTKTFESIWGSNAKGWFQSEGMLLLYTLDIERYRDAYFNLIDPYRFPGTMIERFERPVASTGGANPGKFGGGDFVGGVALDGMGLAAMHLKPAEGALEARRAWFFVGDQVVCLGAGIGAASENPVETTLENARILSDKQKLIVDGKPAPDATTNWPGAKWAWLGGSRPGADLGWVFLDGNPALQTLIETRNGSRLDTHIVRGDPTPLSMRFATLWLDHGKGQTNGTHAWVILPGRSAEQVQAYAAKPGVQILTNTPTLQVVRDAAAGFTGIVGWQAGEIEKIQFDQPVLLAIHESDGKLSVAVSDPTMKLNSPVKIQLPQAVKAVVTPNERIKVVSPSPLVLEFDPAGANGQTQRVEFSR